MKKDRQREKGGPNSWVPDEKRKANLKAECHEYTDVGEEQGEGVAQISQPGEVEWRELMKGHRHPDCSSVPPLASLKLAKTGAQVDDAHVDLNQP